jgi:hypothetical protein
VVERSPDGAPLVTGLLLTEIAGFALGRRIFASKHLQVALSDPGVSRAIVFRAVAASLIGIVRVGLAASSATPPERPPR